MRNVADELIATGRHWATSEQIATLTGLERSHVYPGIQRLVRDNKLFSPARGLYVAIPPEYRKWGAVPADWFIDAAMDHLGRDYYVGFLTAAAAHGAAHQAPQFFQVVVDQHLADRDFGRVRLRFITSKRAGRVPTERRNSRVSGYTVAAPEIVALDLAERPELGAGLSNVTTVLRELPLTDVGLIARQAHHYPRAASRRLGWLLEEVRDDLDLTVLRSIAAPANGELAPLDPHGPHGRGSADKRWGVRINADVDPDR